MDQSLKSLEYYKILEMLGEHAVSETAKQKLLNLKPYLNQSEVQLKTQETTEGRKILDVMGTPPLSTMKDILMIVELSQKGVMLIPEQLNHIAQFITSCQRMKSYLKRAEAYSDTIAYYGESIHELNNLYEEIITSIRNNTVDDNASKELKDIRRKMDHISQNIKTKLDSILRSKKEYFTDGYVSKRNGHYVLPVKKEYKNQIGGSVLDISSTGSTYFIEPSAVIKLEDELSLLQIEEDNEVRKILYTLTGLVESHAMTIQINMEAFFTLDIIFAKARLSQDMKAIPARMSELRTIKIVNGRHPLINPKECVPLNFSIGNGIHGIVITGPNTGGKTVALKTVGLLALMAQSGLHVPCEDAEICMSNAVLCDIGDGQSITENLSTFSSHITNIISILNHSDRESLILLDELGSGTDPAEGMGIAIAILEELKDKGCLFVATTHYPEIKEYATQSEFIVNAKMAFDRESLKPLYQLQIGEAGESCALYIAKRLGLPKRMLQRAYDEAYKKSKDTITPVIDNSFLNDMVDQPTEVKTVSLQQDKNQTLVNSRSERFQIGDSVLIYPQKKIGIVYQRATKTGEIGVQIQHKKQLVNHKRLQLIAPVSELYPDNYDFSIIFDTVENRKSRHKMEKGHQPGLEIRYEKDVSK